MPPFWCYELSEEERVALELQGWRRAVDFFNREGKIPALSDSMVACAVQGTEWEWIVDKAAQLKALGLMEGRDFGIGPVERLPADVPSPIVVKPRYSDAAGIGRGARRSYQRALSITDREMWQQMIEGRHWSVDFILKNGLIQWEQWAEGIPDPEHFGHFVCWLVHEFGRQVNPIVPDRTRELARKWIQGHLFQDIGPQRYPFSGVLNLEMVGNIPIEVHFRPSVEFGHLFGRQSVAQLFDAACGDVDACLYRQTIDELHGGVMYPIPKQRVALHEVEGETVDGPDTWRDRLIYRVG